jgi:hypothetical protein
MWFVAVVLVVVVGAVLFEYRLRRPDQLILFDARGRIGFRTSRWYPRHFSLALPGTVHTLESRYDVTARGSIPVAVKISATVAPAREHIDALIRLGGWDAGAVGRAARELETMLQGLVKGFAEKLEIEELSAERIQHHLVDNAPASAATVGLIIVTMTIQSVDPVDASIADALRQRESARILEQSELLSQKARVAAAQARVRADGEIAALDHEITMKRYNLRQREQEQEATLARQRTEDELARSRMKLAYDKEELSLLQQNPHLLLLTPQAARLAEASQSLKNARTIVSLGPGDAEQGTGLIGLLQTFLQNIVRRPGHDETGDAAKP